MLNQESALTLRRVLLLLSCIVFDFKKVKCWLFGCLTPQLRVMITLLVDFGRFGLKTEDSVIKWLLQAFSKPFYNWTREATFNWDIQFPRSQIWRPVWFRAPNCLFSMSCWQAHMGLSKKLEKWNGFRNDCSYIVNIFLSTRSCTQ